MDGRQLPATSSQALRGPAGAGLSPAQARRLGEVIDRAIRWERRRRIATVVLGIPVTALLGWTVFFGHDGVGFTREGSIHTTIILVVMALGVRLGSGVLHRALVDGAAVAHGVDRRLLAEAIGYAARHRTSGERALLEVSVAVSPVLAGKD